MNRGFTLIELIAIIVVLIAIFLVSFPSILNIFNTNEELKETTMKESLCLAGESYIYSNIDIYNKNLSIVGEEIIIKIADLIKYGNVDKDIVNNKNINLDLLVYTVLDDYSLECRYQES